jgi:hypothetical protein
MESEKKTHGLAPLSFPFVVEYSPLNEELLDLTSRGSENIVEELACPFVLYVEVIALTTSWKIEKKRDEERFSQVCT